MGYLVKQIHFLNFICFLKEFGVKFIKLNKLKMILIQYGKNLKYLFKDYVLMVKIKNLKLNDRHEKGKNN